jgi:hypothetical protein
LELDEFVVEAVEDEDGLVRDALVLDDPLRLVLVVVVLVVPSLFW